MAGKRHGQRPDLRHAEDGLPGLREIVMRRIATCLVWLALLPVAAIAQQPLPPQTPATVEGQPIETRKTEKADDKPLFPEQTRAPYHASAPFKVTTLVDGLHVVWGMDFLPDGRML